MHKNLTLTRVKITLRNRSIACAGRSWTYRLFQVLGIGAILITVSMLIVPQSYNRTVSMVIAQTLLWVLFLLFLHGVVTFHRKKLEKESLLKRIATKKVNYLEKIIHNTADVLLTIDSDLRVLKFNTGAQLHTGYTQQEILGKELTLIFEEKKLSEIVAYARQRGSCINEDIIMKTKNGSTKLFTLSMSQLTYENLAINGFSVLAKDITAMRAMETQLRQKNEQLSLLAITDSLTGLYNVRNFYEQIKKELKRVHRNPAHKMSLILIDIDHFKELNDCEGHQMGDHVLTSLAEVIRACIRDDLDLAFRYGGDEFVIVLPDTGYRQASIVSERILKQFCAFKFGKTSLSIGITEAKHHDNEETIVKRADDAMYSAKRNGKGCIAIG